MKFCLTLSFIQPDLLCEIARTAEEYGWDAVSVSDHLVNPDKIEAKYPYNEDGERMWNHSTPWPDVWVSTAMMAAVTQKLEFLQSVYILPMRDPFHVAKAVGTLAIMSNHRVNLGIGLGWMFDEFKVVGASWERRGKRMDEMVEVMKKLWTGDLVEHHGEFFDFDPLSMAPGVGQNVPIIVGGISDFALRRTARLGDGWAPAYLPIASIREGVDKIREYQKEYGREGAEIKVFTSAVDFAEADGYKRLEDAGVTHTTGTPWINYDGAMDYQKMIAGVPLDTILDGIKRFSDEVISKAK